MYEIPHRFFNVATTSDTGRNPRDELKNSAGEEAEAKLYLRRSATVWLKDGKNPSCAVSDGR
jgi:hypothetical protein